MCLVIIFYHCTRLSIVYFPMEIIFLSKNENRTGGVQFVFIVNGNPIMIKNSMLIVVQCQMVSVDKIVLDRK